MLKSFFAPFGIFFMGLAKFFLGLVLGILCALVLLSAMFFGAYNSGLFTGVGDTVIKPMAKEYLGVSYEPAVFSGPPLKRGASLIF